MSDDVINVYCGQDGAVDYDTPVAVMALDDTQVEIPDQNLPPETIWHYVRRRQRECLLESESSNACIVYIGADGEMLLAAPNPPQDLRADVISGGRIRLRWRYGSAGQEAAPSGFAIFMDSRGVPTSALNYYRKVFSAGWFPEARYQSRWLLTCGWFGPSGNGIEWYMPAAILAHGGSQRGEFQWISPALNNGQVYRFAVRSYLAGGGVSQNCDYVTAVADSLGPAAITVVMAEVL